MYIHICQDINSELFLSWKYVNRTLAQFNMFWTFTRSKANLYRHIAVIVDPWHLRTVTLVILNTFQQA